MGTVELTWENDERALCRSMKNLTYRVGDDEDVGIGRGISSGLGEVTDDRGVGVEEIYR